MTWTYIDREIAEEAWAEYWQELQADEEALRLWNEAQAKDDKLQAEIETLIEQGLEIPF
jgi:hypothetical protein